MKLQTATFLVGASCLVAMLSGCTSTASVFDSAEAETDSPPASVVPSTSMVAGSSRLVGSFGDARYFAFQKNTGPGPRENCLLVVQSGGEDFVASCSASGWVGAISPTLGEARLYVDGVREVSENQTKISNWVVVLSPPTS
ncbi:hypothetical protein [Subtercola boreus]|uniref:hypothetical protein n=1 Tax=Subtercola boreus TaxID=120213 RepID=UPI0011C06D80|nr:hypothetical protein [Subtercola boreus]